MKNFRFPFLIFLLGTVLFQGCIEDDFLDDEVDPVLRFTSSVNTIEIDTEFQLAALFTNNVGQEETPPLTWTSLNPDILTVNSTGLVTAINSGIGIIEVSYDTPEGVLLSDQISIEVGEATVIEPTERSGTIATTTFYVLEGEFILDETDDGLLLQINDSYMADPNLPGLYVYLSNNPNSIANALEISEVTTFSGAHEFEIPNVGINDYNFLVYFCKPFNVKVGDGTIN
jgi:Bacterial Ig-like domain (group 2)./Electron transfer DM13.